MTFIRESEPTFRTEPSSRPTRARPPDAVLISSCHMTSAFADAGNTLAPRSMFAAGMTRETSPARWPLPCAAAGTSGESARVHERRNTRPRLHGDFVFIGNSPVSLMLYLTLLLESGVGVN